MEIASTATNKNRLLPSKLGGQTKNNFKVWLQIMKKPLSTVAGTIRSVLDGSCGSCQGNLASDINAAKKCSTNSLVLFKGC